MAGGDFSARDFKNHDIIPFMGGIYPPKMTQVSNIFIFLPSHLDFRAPSYSYLTVIGLRVHTCDNACGAPLRSASIPGESPAK